MVEGLHGSYRVDSVSVRVDAEVLKALSVAWIHSVRHSFIRVLRSGKRTLNKLTVLYFLLWFFLIAMKKYSYVVV